MTESAGRLGHPIDRRTFLAGAAGAAGALYLGACGGGSGTSARVLHLAGTDAGFPSPFAYSRGPGYVQMSYIYDTLLWTDASGRQLPWLASRVRRSSDGLTYTFELRDNVRWHDGRPLTAADVAFTFDYYAKQTLSPEIIAMPVPGIAEVKATGPRTVEFRLKAPITTFLGFGGAGAVPIVPKHIWESIDHAAMVSDPKVLVGSGPYRLKSYSGGDGSYLYTANDEYFLGKPFVKRIENRPVGDPLTGLKAGEIDAATVLGVTPAVLKSFRNDASFGILQQPPGALQLALNWNLAKGGALADVRFRQACAKVINREDIVKRAFGGNGTPGNPGWVPPGNPWHVDVEQYPFDPAGANRLLDRAGYKKGSDGLRSDRDGKPLRFGLVVATPVPPAAEVVVRALKAIGVEAKPEAVDMASFIPRLVKGDTELSLIMSGGMNTGNEPDYLRTVYSSKTKSVQHAQGYVNAEVDRLAQQQLVTLDEGKRKPMVARIQQLVARDVPVLPLFYPDSFHVFKRSAFDAWYVTPGGVAGSIPLFGNKQAFITGAKTGLKVRS